MVSRRFFLAVASFVLVLGLLLPGCQTKQEKKTTTRQTETSTGEQTSQTEVSVDLDEAQKETSEALSEVENDIRDIQDIDTNQDNESGY